jgi:signal transduction histidine kinase
MLKLSEISDEYLPLWNHPKSNEILRLMSDLYGLKQTSKIIEVSVDKTSKIVYALKSYTIRDIHGKPILYSITEGIQSVLIIYENQIKQGIDLNFDFEEKIPEIYCYPDEINQVWTNLIYNAVQATNGKGKLEIYIKRISFINSNTSSGSLKDGIEVCIMDNGTGIAKEIQKNIFDPFFTTKKAGEGTGLGLHVCKEIIIKHGGEIFFESQPGLTKFFVHLPYEN